jgi:predicted NAD/FAD-binding protein
VRIAVVGTGISGMFAAWQLARAHEVVVFEAAERLGGHTHTVQVEDPNGSIAVDTGFIVFNEVTYPHFTGLLRELDVASKPSDMSFSVTNTSSGLEYSGSSLDGLFAQRRNFLRPGFWRMLLDIRRFYRESPAVLGQPGFDGTLAQYLEERSYSRAFAEDHLLPMAAAVWSSGTQGIGAIPMRFLVEFFRNHGFLAMRDRPQWLVVEGGSQRYVDRLMRPLSGRIHLNTAVASVRPSRRGVILRSARGDEARFDRVVLATHADQSLRMLADPTPEEHAVLGAFAYQRNEVLLHTDAACMPRSRRAWASWNYRVEPRAEPLPGVTYWMNRLQGLQARRDYFVTLNPTERSQPQSVLRRLVYHHPVFSAEAVRAQALHGLIDGRRGVHYCGAYWRYGFHEDGVVSAMAVLRNIERSALGRARHSTAAEAV